jgi:hypothetical protein
MIAQILTPDQIRQEAIREYNPYEWDKNVDRMLTKYAEPVFYLVEAGNGYDYNRYFVEYTLPEGLRLFDSFSYGGGITNGGFYRLDTCECNKDGKTANDAIEMFQNGDEESAKALLNDIRDSKLVSINYGMFHDQTTGEMVMIGTSKEARAWMTERSVKYGTTFTQG